MRYSPERRKRIYVEGYGFLSLAIKFGDKCGKTLMDIATNSGIDAAKTASKRVVQKTAEATGDLIGNKITDKIALEGKTKNKRKRRKIKWNRRNLHTTRKETANYWCFKIVLVSIKTEYQKITNLYGNIPEKVPKCIDKKWMEVHDQSGNADNKYKPNKKIWFKRSIFL